MQIVNDLRIMKNIKQGQRFKDCGQISKIFKSKIKTINLPPPKEPIQTVTLNVSSQDETIRSSIASSPHTPAH